MTEQQKPLRSRTLPRRLGSLAVRLCAILWVLQFLAAVFGWHELPLRWLSAAEPNAPPPAVIVVLGGGGIPSRSGLLRCFHAASLAQTYPRARCVVSLPAENPETDSVGRMRDELVMRGVAPDRIALETQARNTREQAEALRRLLGEAALGEPVWLVTSGAHARRSVLCFRKAGFGSVYGATAREEGAEGDLGPGVFWRYVFWSRLEEQAEILRELAAMAYYRMKGWI